MKNDIIQRLSILGLSLILAGGLLAGCGSGDADSTSAETSEKQVEKQSEEDHEHHDEHAESKHKDEEHHDEEGHEHGHDHGPDHFEGKKAETYDEAVSNMKEANQKLADLLAKDEFSGGDFHKIHRMSYTMENALAKIQEESDGDYSDVAKNLESVHLASEKRNAETVRENGKKYLKGAKAMLEKGQDHAKSHHDDKEHHDEDGHEHGHDHGPDHFEGKKAETYDEAISNMKEANSKLADLLAKDKLAGEDFYKIHRMSYTMENALAKIRDESDGDYSDVAKNLEAVHLASEKRDAETVRQNGKKYLEGTKAILEKE